MVVARAGLVDVRADQEGAVSDVGRARFDTAQNLSPFIGPATEIEHAHLIGVADLGVDHSEVAERLQIGMEAVSRMERGIVVPTIVRLAELAQIFGCELTDLLRETSSRPLEQAVRLAHQLEQLTDDDRQWVTDTMTALMSRLIR